MNKAYHFWNISPIFEQITATATAMAYTAAMNGGRHLSLSLTRPCLQSISCTFECDVHLILFAVFAEIDEMEGANSACIHGGNMRMCTCTGIFECKMRYTHASTYKCIGGWSFAFIWLSSLFAFVLAFVCACVHVHAAAFVFVRVAMLF